MHSSPEVRSVPVLRRLYRHKESGVIVVSPGVFIRSLVTAALIVIALLFLGARAHADEMPAQDPPAGDVAGPPPAAPTEEPVADPPAGAGGPDVADALPGTGQSDQNAAVKTTGTAIADTGQNNAGAAASGGITGVVSTAAGSNAVTGNATATGAAGTSAIDQRADAAATGQGAVDILQIALVVNIGVGNATTGSNVAGAGAATGAGAAGAAITAGVGTGNVGAIGNDATTGITQSAVVGNGDAVGQSALVVNVGIAIGNSGLNISIGVIDGKGGQASGQLYDGPGAALAGVVTGDATATGDRSSSRITQAAQALASGTAVLTIDQRALVLNFGTAYANSGGNLALASFDASALSAEHAAIVRAVLAVLAPLFASSGPVTAQADTGLPGSALTTTATAAVVTGTATATGNASRTAISQGVIGTADGTAHAAAHQTAVVGNLGLAFANTGLNAALAGAGFPAEFGTELMSATDALATFLMLLTDLSWLEQPNPFAYFTKSIDLNGLGIDLSGTLEGGEFLLGWDRDFAPDGGPIPGGVRVRQISGVINIGISTADSGHNTAVSLAALHHEGSADAVHSVLALLTGGASADALIDTGDATAVGNRARVTVCQTFNDAMACVDEPTEPPAEPVIAIDAATAAVAPEPAAAPAPAPATLPVTGGDARALAEIAGALLAAGVVLASRRRRGVSSGHAAAGRDA